MSIFVVVSLAHDKSCGSSLVSVCECAGGAEAGRAGGDQPRSEPRVDSPRRRGTTVDNTIFEQQIQQEY